MSGMGGGSASATIGVMRWIVPALVTAFTVGCAYHEPAAPTPIVVAPSTAPASIRLVGATRPDRSLDMTATVLTASGAFVSGVKVDLFSTAGTLSPSSGITDANACHCIGLGGAGAHQVGVSFLAGLTVLTSPTLDGPWTVAAHTQ